MAVENCPQCAANAVRVETLRDKQVETEAKVQELKAALTQAQKDAADAKVLAERKPDLPSVKSFLAHCEEEDGDCAHHKDWQRVKENIIKQALDNLPDDALEKRALEKGILPKRIVFK